MAQHKTLAEVRDKLRLSKLAAQTELLTTDLDLRELSMFNRQFRKPMRIEESVVAGTVHRTITGASTVVSWAIRRISILTVFGSG